MNPREFELLNLLSAHETTGKPAAKPVKLAKILAGDPAAPAMTDLMAVAAQTADAGVVEKVTTYCKAHPEYGEMLEQFARFAKDEEIPEPPIEGSILERLKGGDFTEQVSSLRGGETTQGDYLPVREAARSKGVPVDEIQQAIVKGELISDVRGGEHFVSVQSLNLWHPQPRSRPVDALQHALAVSTGPESPAWLARKLTDGSTLLVVPASAVNLIGVKAGGNVRIDLPEIGSADAQLRYADQDVAILSVGNKKEVR